MVYLQMFAAVQNELPFLPKPGNKPSRVKSETNKLMKGLQQSPMMFCSPFKSQFSFLTNWHAVSLEIAQSIPICANTI